MTAQDSEPLGWCARPVTDVDASRCRRFEFSSRGDRVVGVLAEPVASAPAPLLLVARAAEVGDATLLGPLCEALPTTGVAVAQLDLPLHGARAERKLAECVEEGLRGRGPMVALAQEFIRQSLMDLRRGIDALTALAGIDAQRIAFAGVGLAGEIGAHFCAADERPRAAILARAGRPSEHPALDACSRVGAIAPRPLLVIDAPAGAADPAAEHAAPPGRLYQAAGEPRIRHTLDGDASAGDPALQQVMQRFLREALEL